MKNRAIIKQTNEGQHRAFMEQWIIADADKRGQGLLALHRGKASCKQAVRIPGLATGKRDRFCACPHRAGRSNTSARPMPQLDPIAKGVAPRVALYKKPEGDKSASCQEGLARAGRRAWNRHAQGVAPSGMKNVSRTTVRVACGCLARPSMEGGLPELPIAHGSIHEHLGTHGGNQPMRSLPPATDVVRDFKSRSYEAAQAAQGQTPPSSETQSSLSPVSYFVPNCTCRLHGKDSHSHTR